LGSCREHSENPERSRQLLQSWTARKGGVNIARPMTSLVSWVGVDHRKPASIYIASDSRISWGGDAVWDFGRKVFASRSRPEIFGYVGDVFFPSLVLGQIADAPASPGEAASTEERFDKITRTVQQAFGSLPGTERRPFRIAYAVRVGTAMAAVFRLFSLDWGHATGWNSREELLPKASDSIVIWGSGAAAVETWRTRWSNSSQGGTSRALFSAFCDAIGSRTDSLSGGAPQLVGLYRIGEARTIGIIHDGHPYLFGLKADASDHTDGRVEWRNRLFERCNAQGVQVVEAQRHHLPRGLGATGGAAHSPQRKVGRQ
jgi:hypothetical protein